MRHWLLAGVVIGCLLSGTSAFAGKGNNTAANKGSAAESVVGLVLDAPATDGGNDVNPFYGKINPFYGNINPFYGKINPFYGNISPFWGDITPFWGDVNPFYGKIDPFYGNINPFWGNITPFDSSIAPFWQNAGPEWGVINTAWTNLQASSNANYSDLQTQLKAFINENATFWGGAVQKYTGKNFNDGFATAMLAKYGIDPNNASSLAGIDAETRSAFFLNWYDRLMDFTGVDHVDWWMPAVDWSPALTQIQNSNGKVVVGILDSTFDGDATGIDNVKFTGGYKLYVNQHGGAVASLIAAQQDGKGVMGIAPHSTIQLYNPFDASGTTNWNDVATGIDALYKKGAAVINASLGTPGWTFSQEWVSIMSGPLLSARKHDLVIVKAAGNEGVTQTANISWLPIVNTPNNLIVVGSVGPTGQISSFSNTPGEACMTVLGICAEQNKLKYHFIVAPGELMLVSDGQGGVTRMSGTSFAAPLVTGAIALLQDRWPWLKQHADETTQIIFRSAKDLGAPGVDPVYGWGELDIEASQSPLNFNNLVVYKPFTYTGNPLNPLSTLLPNWSAQSLKSSVLNAGQLNLWQNQKAYIVAIEPIGTTYRDFTIPLSSTLVGQSQKTSYSSNPFQSYLYQRMIDWAHGSKFENFASQNVAMADGDWSMSFTASDPLPEEVQQTGISRDHVEFQMTDAKAGVDLRFGEGNGSHGLMTGVASQLEKNGSFALATDFDPATGGVDPILGLASGGAYAQGGLTFGNARISFGMSQKSDDHVYLDPTYGPIKTVPLPADMATASVAGFDYNLSKSFALNASFTSLDENNSLLGAQGAGALSLAGTHTNAMTVGGTAEFGDGWEMAVSATTGDTQRPNTDNMLTLTSNLRSTAYELVATKMGVFDKDDELHVTFAQPMHIESGTLQYSSMEVVNRDTGALGAVTQTWNISGNREERVEALYAKPVLDGRAEIAGFGLVDVNGPETNGQSTELAAGLQFNVKF